MSKQIPAQIKCPSCDDKFNVKLYRSIWIEDPKNRELIFQDEINAVTCPLCKKKTRLEFPFLCTNIKKEIAIWYEPYHDPEVDKDIAQYKSHMGANSFYAKAPRIQDWKEFKEKIVEYEGSRSNANSFEISEEMNDAFSGFMGNIEKENQRLEKEILKYKHSKYLRHLSANKWRLLYSPVPFLLLLLWLYFEDPSDFVRDISPHINEVIFVGIILTVGSYIALTIFVKIKEHWSTRKDVRLWSFCSIFWIVGVFLYVLILNDGSLKYMRDGEYFQMFMLMFVPPFFIGAAKYVYEKYIS